MSGRQLGAGDAHGGDILFGGDIAAELQALDLERGRVAIGLGPPKGLEGDGSLAITCLELVGEAIDRLIQRQGEPFGLVGVA